MAKIVMNRAGAALGLEITAKGANDYRLRGTPMLVLRDATVREPGAETPLLRARRIHVSLPWSTLRSGGEDLVIERIELDEPTIDLPALQHWLASRPPSEPRLPTFSEGLQITDGTLIHREWRIDGIQTDIAELDPQRPLHAQFRARYVAAPLSVPFDLSVSLADPRLLIQTADSAVAVTGRMTVEHGKDWRLPATLKLSGPVHYGDDETRIAPLHLGVAGTLESGERRTPFALGVHGPLRVVGSTITLAPLGLAVRGRGPDAEALIPDLSAEGSLAYGPELALKFDGQLAQWPQAWPALPPPIGQSTSPLPFSLAYQGPTDLAGRASLQVARDQTRFDGQFHLPQVLDWVDALENEGAPLPPLTGRVSAPRIEVSGVTLEGVEVELEDDATPESGTP